MMRTTLLLALLLSQVRIPGPGGASLTGGGGIAPVGTAVAATAASATTLTLTKTLTAGDLAVVALAKNTANVIASVTGSVSGAYTLATSCNDTFGANAQSSIYYKANTSSGSETVTITVTAGFNAMTGTLSEWSGVLTTSPLDQVGCNGSSNGPNPTVVTSGATAQASELVIAVAGANGATLSVGSGYTLVATSPIAQYFNEYVISGATGVQTAGFTGLSDFYWQSIATFKH